MKNHSGAVENGNLASLSTFTRLLAACAVLAAFCLRTAPASAQDETFYLDRIQIAGAPDDGFAVQRPYMFEKTRLYGSLSLGYSLNPLRVGTVNEGEVSINGAPDLVQNQFISYMGVGGEFFNTFSVDLMLPIAWVTDGDVPSVEYGINGGNTGVAVHDMRFGARWKAFESEDGTVRLGLGSALFLPTGNTTTYGGDGTVTGFLYGTGEVDLGSFILTGNMGPHFRPNRAIDGTNSALVIDHELRMAFGVYVPLRDDVWRIGGEIFGSTGLASDTTLPYETTGGHNTIFNNSNTPFEWLASVRYQAEDWVRPYVRAGGGTRFTDGYGAPDFRLLVQVGYWLTLKDFEPEDSSRGFYKPPEPVEDDLDTDGDGFPDSIDACPTIKEDGKPPNPGDGCPADADRDGDGIPDVDDKCPDVPEDFDNIQDEDGCPEDDADDDGIPDAEDACPLVPGLESPDPKKNGCPRKKHKRIIEEGDEIVLLEPIQFETAKADIKAVSFPILDEVVSVMQERPDVRIAVHGHTDIRGGHEYNVNLSKLRAASVVSYLVGKGIDRKRLESEGFGPDQPIDTNETAEGRTKNRRVEFKIIE